MRYHHHNTIVCVMTSAAFILQLYCFDHTVLLSLLSSLIIVLITRLVVCVGGILCHISAFLSNDIMCSVNAGSIYFRLFLISSAIKNCFLIHQFSKRFLAGLRLCPTVANRGTGGWACGGLRPRAVVISYTHKPTAWHRAKEYPPRADVYLISGREFVRDEVVNNSASYDANFTTRVVSADHVDLLQQQTECQYAVLLCIW